MTGAPLTPADLAYDEAGVPRSVRYGDLYYSAEDGLAETQHVFIAGNDLPARMRSLGHGGRLTIGELGFGTGLNVMAAMTAFAERGHTDGHLWIWSVEAHPLDTEDFGRSAERIIARWPRLAPAARALAAAYPVPVPGQAALRLGPDVTMVLAFSDAAAALKEAQLSADAWFLDGFSPDRNPDMWSPEVMALVAERSAPGATAATFTVAGTVRRGLTAASFEVRKTPGFGRKREMTRAALPGVTGATRPPRVAVIGAGIAGTCAAWHLRRRGAEVVVFDPEGPAAGASGNPVGLVTPRFEAQDTPLARLYRDAYAYACGFYGAEAPDAIHSRGAEVKVKPGRRDKLLSLGLWPRGALEPCPDGLCAPGALSIDPGRAIRTLLGEDAVRQRPTLIPEGGAWGLACADRSWQADVVILAGGPAVRSVDLGVPVLSASRGQIDLFAGAPPRITSGDGYVAPAGERMAAGATYAPADPGEPVAADARSSAANAAVAARLTGRDPGPALASRASLRAVTPDRHPLLGLTWDRPPLLVLGGLGSRGLGTAPLLGLAASAVVTNDPSPLTRAQAAVLAPGRFEARAARRR